MKSRVRLIIDASVARASGGELAGYPDSVNCRDFLIAVYDTRHRVAMTRTITDEWNNHASSFARTWLVNMRKYNRVAHVNTKSSVKLQNEIDCEQVQYEAHRNTMHKDRCLLEAALETDKRVASLDEEVRRLFHCLSIRVVDLQQIIWINPARPQEECILWLKEGAKDDKFRRLGYREANTPQDTHNQ